MYCRQKKGTVLLHLISQTNILKSTKFQQIYPIHNRKQLMPWRIPALLERSTDEHFGEQQGNLELSELIYLFILFSLTQASLFQCNSVLTYTSGCNI